MPTADLAFMTAGEAAAEIRAGRASPVDLVEALLARIEAHEPAVGAFTTVYRDDALLAAEAAHKAIRAGHGVGPWHGVPIALKDLIDIEGRVTTGGSRHWAARVSPATATLARRAIAAGMIVLGKTHTVEFAMGGWGTNRRMGSPRNPWDRETHRAAGGSSSGSGAAVAARLAPWAIGTDTGGSVRIPSAWCGLTGLKTTIGRISAAGVLPLAPTLDTPGPMARSVEDAACLYALLQGPDAADPPTLRRAPDDPLPALRRGVAGLRLGLLPETERAGLDAEVLAAYDAAVETLAAAGARTAPLALPQPTSRYGALVGRLIGAEGYALLGDLVDDPALPLDDDVRPRIQLAAVSRPPTISSSCAGARTINERRWRRSRASTPGSRRPWKRRRRRWPRSIRRRPRPASHGRSTGSTGAPSPCRTASPTGGCLFRCTSSAAATTRRRRSASAGPTSRPPTGIPASRRGSTGSALQGTGISGRSAARGTARTGTGSERPRTASACSAWAPRSTPARRATSSETTSWQP